MYTRCEIDHLVVGADTLAQGAAFIETLLGVKPHPVRDTLYFILN